MLLTDMQTSALFNEFGLRFETQESTAEFHLNLQFELDASLECFRLSITCRPADRAGERYDVFERIDPLLGLHRYQINNMAADLYLPQHYWHRFEVFLGNIDRMIAQTDVARLILAANVYVDRHIGINHAWIALDDHAAFRLAYGQITMDEHLFHRTEMDGVIAFMGNGAGIVLSTVDTLCATYPTIPTSAASLIELDDDRLPKAIEAACVAVAGEPAVQLIVINCVCTLWGCDDVVARLIVVAQSVLLPMLIRIEGARTQEAQALLANAHLPHVISVATTQELVDEIAVWLRGNAYVPAD